MGLPMLAVEATQLTKMSALRVTRRRAQLEYQGQILPVVDLGSRLGLRAAHMPSEGQPLMVISAGGKRVALAVDAVVGDRDLVIRPLPAEVRDVPAYQGAATLSRGELMLILRPSWLVSEPAPLAASAPQSRRALVVDDSLTARALHRAMLEAGGFTVHLASSGERALERLQADSTTSSSATSRWRRWTARRSSASCASARRRASCPSSSSPRTRPARRAGPGRGRGWLPQQT